MPNPHTVLPGVVQFLLLRCNIDLLEVHDGVSYVQNVSLIVHQSTPALWHRKHASSAKSRDIDGAQVSDNTAKKGRPQITDIFISVYCLLHVSAFVQSCHQAINQYTEKDNLTITQ
jgi:hypothetical protein